MGVMSVYVTAGTAAEAQRIAQTVVEERLAACANIIDGMKSIYWWNGRVQEFGEAVLILKTTTARLEALTARVRTLHSYDCPCIEAVAVVGGNPAFLDWIARETGDAAGRMAGETAIVIDRLDHLVLTVRDIDVTCRFYARVLSMRAVEQGGRFALHFGRQKINLHRAGHEFEPKAAQTLPGTGDFCLITETPLDQVIAHLDACGVAVEHGPVPKQGALGAMRSVYFRDPDANLVEVSNYL